MTAPRPGQPVGRADGPPQPAAPDRGEPDPGAPDPGKPDLGGPDRGEPDPGVPELGGATGHPAVDAALTALDQVAPLPPEDQVAAYERAHRALRETLSTILVPAPSGERAAPSQSTKPTDTN